MGSTKTGTGRDLGRGAASARSTFAGPTACAYLVPVYTTGG